MSDECGYTLWDLQRLRDSYGMHPYPSLQEGDPVGWVDQDGDLHVDTYHGESQRDPLRQLQATLSAAHDVLRDITGETRESRVLAAIAELEALEDSDDISRTVLWQLKEGRRGDDGPDEHGESQP